MSIKGIIACFLVISFLSMSAIPINAETPQATASILIDFGNGNSYWADVPVSSGMNAFNLTVEATTALNLPIDYSTSAYGVMVNSIGSAVGQWPHEYWHFWTWNSTTSSWMMSMQGASDVNASSFPAYAWSFVQDRADYSSPVPTSNPVNRYSWEQSRHDNYNTGFSYVPTSISNDTVFGLDLNNGKIDPAVVIGPNQNVYVVTEGIYNWTSYSYDKSPKVFCVTPGGEIVWSANITGGGYQLASPLVVGDQVIVPSTDGTVFSFNAANGSQLWTYSVPFSYTGVTSSPIVYRDQIIIASGDGNVTALALNGTKLWNTRVASSIYFSAPAAKDGMIYIGSEDSKLFAVHADGSGVAWNVTVPGKVRSSPLLLDDKIVITYAVYSGFVAVDGGVAAYNYTGTQLWNVNVNSTSTSPALTTKGIVVTSVKGVTMVSQNGTVLWTKDLGVVKSSASVSLSGIYLVTYGSPATAYMLDLNGNVVFSMILSPAAYAMSSPAITDGRVYVASDNGYLICLMNMPPTGTFSYTKDDLKVSFAAEASDNESLTITWDFGDGSYSTGTTCNHTYDSAGDYNVTVRVTDANGANMTLTRAISVSAAGTDNTMTYLIVVLVALVLVAVIAVVFIRSRKK